MKKTKRRQFKKGFTLLELIVVIAIIAIMTIVMLVTMFEDRENRELAAAARGVTAAIREAQNNALAGLSRGDEFICMSVLNFDKTPNRYVVRKWKKDPSSGNCNFNDNVASYYFDYDVERMIEDGDIGRLQFSVPHGDIKVNLVTTPSATTGANPLTGTGQIRLHKRDSGSAKVFYVCIHPSGQIVENGINNPC